MAVGTTAPPRPLPDLVQHREEVELADGGARRRELVLRSADTERHVSTQDYGDICPTIYSV
jgi:hypothetical protein